MHEYKRENQKQPQINLFCSSSSCDNHFKHNSLNLLGFFIHSLFEIDRGTLASILKKTRRKNTRSASSVRFLLAFWRFDIGEEGEGGRGEMV
jgi:hypothetical protein